MDKHMALALHLAKRAQPFPNPRVGAVLVRGGRAIGEGWHRAPGEPHAEIEAMTDAKRRAGDPHATRGATLYVTLEPCSHNAKRTPPCTREIVREGIAKVVFAMEDPNPLVDGAGELRRAGVRVVGPTETRAARAINRRYLESTGKKPFVAIKMAMSADGRTAARSGDSKWISSPESRALVHRMRAGYGAVMVGAGTVMRDDPALTSHGNGKDPLRIIIDGRLRCSPNARAIRKKDGKALVIACENAPRARARALERAGAKVAVCGRGEVDLEALMRALGAMGLRKVLIEGGSELNASALEAGIVDSMYIFISPKIIGGRDAKGVFGGEGIASMSEARHAKLLAIMREGPDVLLEYALGKKAAGRKQKAGISRR